MCGRFAQNTPPDELRKRFKTKNPLVNADPSSNITPTETALVVRWNRKTDERGLDKLRWGLVPMGAPDLSFAAKQINARSETLSERPAYREAFIKRRCLVPITAFYEWRKLDAQGTNKTKQPYAVAMPDGSPMVLGGLWERWRDTATREITRSFTIITVPANDQLKALHERMPLILEENDWSAWLGETGLGETKDDLAPLLRTYRQELRVWPVSSRVNSVKNKDPELLAPMPADRPA
ncbi:MAG: SOS response-associated peptidase [Rhodospirillales bacterium]